MPTGGTKPAIVRFCAASSDRSRRRAPHLHLVAHLADLEGGLRSGRRSPHDRAVVEAEHAAVPGTHDAAVADLTLVQWTALVGAGGRDGVDATPAAHDDDGGAVDLDPPGLSFVQIGDGRHRRPFT